MMILGLTLVGLMVVRGFVGWCCVRVGALSDQAITEEELDYARECALNIELSDHSFVTAGAGK